MLEEGVTVGEFWSFRSPSQVQWLSLSAAWGFRTLSFFFSIMMLLAMTVTKRIALFMVSHHRNRTLTKTVTSVFLNIYVYE